LIVVDFPIDLKAPRKTEEEIIFFPNFGFLSKVGAVKL